MTRFGAPLLILALLGGCDASKQEQASAPTSDASEPVLSASIAPDEKLARSKTIDAPFGKIRIEEVGLTDGAHVDGGRLAVTYLATGKSYPEAIEGGSFGGFGEWSVDDRFSANPVIVSHSGGTGQGYTCVTTQVTELRPEGPTKLAEFKSHFDNEGVPGDKPQSTDGRIVRVDRDRSFAVEFTGTQAFTAVYTRNGNSYEQRGQPRTLDGC